MLTCVEPIGNPKDIEKMFLDIYLRIVRVEVPIQITGFGDALVPSSSPYAWMATRARLIKLVTTVQLAVRSYLLTVFKLACDWTTLMLPTFTFKGFFDNRVNGRNTP
jgi:hypothetical protein